MEYTSYSSSNIKADYQSAKSISSASTGYYNNYEKVINIKEIPNWIKNERIRQGLSLRELAKRSKVSKSTISNLENGGNPYITTCILIINGLGYEFNLSEGLFRITKKDGANEI